MSKQLIGHLKDKLTLKFFVQVAAEWSKNLEDNKWKCLPERDQHFCSSDGHSSFGLWLPYKVTAFFFSDISRRFSRFTMSYRTIRKLDAEEPWARLDGYLVRSYKILTKNVYLVRSCKTNVYLVRFL